MPAIRGSKVLLRCPFQAQPGLEDLAGLLFHGPPVPGRLHPKAGFHRVINFANDDGRHTGMIALIASFAPEAGVLTGAAQIDTSLPATLL